MKWFKNSEVYRAERLVVIGKAPFDKLRAGYFSFHSQSYGNKNSRSPIAAMLLAQVVSEFLNHFNIEKICCAFQTREFVLVRGTKTRVMRRIMRIFVPRIIRVKDQDQMLKLLILTLIKTAFSEHCLQMTSFISLSNDVK